MPSANVACPVALQRWYFDANLNDCREFTGCDTQGFETQSLCIESCGGGRRRTPPSLDRCILAPERGSCVDIEAKWYWDPESGTCRTFIYGGCSGNENRFDTKADCMTTCGPKTEMSIASQPRQCIAQSNNCFTCTRKCSPLSATCTNWTCPTTTCDELSTDFECTKYTS
mmetsp:Transcript_2965/g.4330  ORF Transcript_2965/g.4330 Transcript_2965/m.4330 type:complete len:170 (-) Transcript_2965:1368-1877(-)